MTHHQDQAKQLLIRKAPVCSSRHLKLSFKRINKLES